ncbi:MAG: aromatic ring-hydroxylating dioxygenase subunit alpha [Candidatus Binataceae bacterium]|nr:aromatic ring-hydroxylating dioxygenase subunit alpha [Candidatus Binataceae bacterium]
MKQVDFSAMVDSGRGLVDRAIFSDPRIYELELERIFARSWLFLAHESQVREPGDYFNTYMGADPILVCRQRDGSLKALLNSCRHRGMKVCRSDFGNARSFMCTYHGWTYSNSGQLTGVPFEKLGYDDRFRREEWGLVEVPRVEVYKGLIFANWDREAPTLREYLGDFAYYMDIMLDRVDGGTEVIGGVQKWRMRGNWKLAAEQFAGDMYHAQTSHLSAAIAEGYREAIGDYHDGIEIDAGGGHGVGAFTGRPIVFGHPAVGAYYEATAAEMVRRIGSDRAVGTQWVHAGMFPNLAWLWDFPTLRIWHPRGPDSIEVWAWCVVERKMPPAVKEIIRLNCQRHFGPSGTWEQDDSENWSYCAGGNGGYIARKYPLNYQMGREPAREYSEFPGRIGSVYSEQNQRALYARWAEMMNAQSWKEISVPGRAKSDHMGNAAAAVAP